MKKTILLLMSLVLVIGLVACSQPQAEVLDNEIQPVNSDENQNPKDAPQGITVNRLKFEEVPFEMLSEAFQNTINENKMEEGYDVIRNEETGELTLAIYLGQRSSAGYDVEVVSIFDNEGITGVTINETTPQEGQMVAEVLTYPYVVVRFSGGTDNINIEKQVNSETKSDDILPVEGDNGNINDCEPDDSIKDPNQAVSNNQEQIVAGEFVGLIDNNSIEVKIEDGPRAFRLSDDVKIIAYDLEEGNIISLTFYENKDNQAIITKIDIEQK